MADHATIKPQQLKSIINGKLLQRIPYMDKPPAMGGQLTYLSHEEFYAKFGCHYYEGIKNGPHSKITIPFAMINDKELNRALARLENPLECLGICNMGEPMGYGLFALDKIRIGTVLCIYSGTVGPVTVSPTSLFSTYGLGNLDAKEIGGISRFMQHMPLSKTNYYQYLLEVAQGRNFFPLPDYNLKTPEDCQKCLHKKDSEHAFDFDKIIFVNDEIKENVATSNVIFNTIRIMGAEFVIMCAMRDIQKHEAIGFSYGIDYWKNPSIKCLPFLFTRQGQIISPENNYSYPEALLKPNEELVKLFNTMQKLNLAEQIAVTKPLTITQSVSSSMFAEKHPDNLSFSSSTQNTSASKKSIQKEVKQILEKYEATEIGQAFRRAAGFGAVEELSLLLQAEPKVINSSGAESKKTALHIATQAKKEENIQFLLEHGADPTMQDACNKTAQEYGVKSVNKDQLSEDKKSKIKLR